jgi:hypothetical protein
MRTRCAAEFGVVRPRVRAVLLLCCLAAAPVSATEPSAYLQELYRADVLRSLPTGAPTAVSMIPPADSPSWPAVLRVALEERIRREWQSDRMYGALSTRIAVWLRYPLVTANVGGRVLVPVLSQPELPIRGRFDLPALRGPRRVILVIDSGTDTAQRAIEPLLASLVGESLELGIVAAGEGAIPVAKPDISGVRLRPKLEAFAAGRLPMRHPGDLECALALADDWLRDTPSGLTREIVVIAASRPAPAPGTKPVTCPAAERLAAEEGSQLAALGRRLRHAVKISALVLGPLPDAQPYRARVEQSDGQLGNVASVEALQRELALLVLGSVRGVYARNLHTESQTGNLQRGGSGEFEGSIALVAGANDVELRVESGPGTAALFRFRVYAADPKLKQLLAELAEQDRALQAQNGSLLDRLGPVRPAPRDLGEIRPAAPRDRITD